VSEHVVEEEMVVPKKLVLVNAYCGWAVYGRGKLLFHNTEGGGWPWALFEEMGYTVLQHPAENTFDFWKSLSWQMPEDLSKLDQLWERWDRKRKQVALASAQATVERLKKELQERVRT
jgi:hypothetical protein